MNPTINDRYSIFIDSVIRFKYQNFTKTEKGLPETIPKEKTYAYFFCNFYDTVLTKPIDTSECFSLDFTFSNCTNLSSIKYLDKIDTQYVRSMRHIFGNDKHLVDYSGIETWDVSHCAAFNHAFEHSGIQSLKYFESWKFRDTHCDAMFKSSDLISLEGLNKIDLSNVISSTEMFANLKITSLKGTENLDLSHIKNPYKMFSNNNKLKNLSPSETWKLPQGISLLDLF